VTISSREDYNWFFLLLYSLRWDSFTHNELRMHISSAFFSRDRHLARIICVHYVIYSYYILIYYIICMYNMYLHWVHKQFDWCRCSVFFWKSVWRLVIIFIIITFHTVAGHFVYLIRRDQLTYRLFIMASFLIYIIF